MLSKKIWDRFLFLLSVDVFGEKAVLTEGKKIKVLYGSVESHFKIFEKAHKEVMDNHLNDGLDEGDIQMIIMEETFKHDLDASTDKS